MYFGLIGMPVSIFTQHGGIGTRRPSPQGPDIAAPPCGFTVQPHGAARLD
jgi:hypothetical protein